MSGKCKIFNSVRNSWCSITTNYKIVLSFMIRCFDILTGCNSALIRIRLHPGPVKVRIWPDPKSLDPVKIRIRPDLTVMNPVGSGSSRILKYRIRCTPNPGVRVDDVLCYVRRLLWRWCEWVWGKYNGVSQWSSVYEWAGVILMQLYTRIHRPALWHR